VPAAAQNNELSNHERYRRLAQAARRTASRRTQRSKTATVERYLRSPAAREAVLLRSEDSCENDRCLGHPIERTDTGMAILEVDHVNDLGHGGDDTPETMIALCPNCHALKTRGRGRVELRRRLLQIARSRHKHFMQDQEALSVTP
jgi:5-methylcytosine-specific restriction enzyme A